MTAAEYVASTNAPGQGAGNSHGTAACDLAAFAAVPQPLTDDIGHHVPVVLHRRKELVQVHDPQ